MTYIHFSKLQLHNLDFSLNHEIIQSNIKGSYSSSSLINCNTRKYHGLFVTLQPHMDENRYVLLSSLDETIIIGSKKIQLGTHRYPSIYYPKGYSYLHEFNYERAPEWIFKTGDIEIKKEILLPENDERVLVRYTVLESKVPFQMQFDPLLAKRNIHTLNKSNFDTSKDTEKIENGIKLKMYPWFSHLCLQFSRATDFVNAPAWNYHNEYLQEAERGYEYSEDLYCPGFFTLSLKKGDQVIFSAGLTEIKPRSLKALFNSELKNRIPLINFKNCLENAARQFIIKNENEVEITAGYHWFGQWGRDTFISLPGLTLTTGQPQICKMVLDSMLKNLKSGLFPNIGKGDTAAFNSADASLWFFWALQQYSKHTKSITNIWKEYGKEMESILSHYRKGTLHNIQMKDNGLLYAGEAGMALTWMDAVVDGKPVTPRIGFVVELNALWYNAICFSLIAADLADDQKFVTEWESLPKQIEGSFTRTFWDEEKKYLADYVNDKYTDWSIRPNQIFAVSLPYSPIQDDIKKSIVETVKNKLLTPRGLRTLSAEDKNYIGIYHGNHRERDLAYHQGTVWPWLLGHFAEAYIKIKGEEGLPLIQSIYENFAIAALQYGIGTIAEIFDGDEPHKAKGAVSQAWSVAELLRIRSMITDYYMYSKNEINETKKTRKLQPII